MSDTPVLDDTPAYLRDTELAAIRDEFKDVDAILDKASDWLGRVAS